MSLGTPRHDLSGRLVSLLVFLAGIGMLIFVFITALHLFQSPVPGLDLPVKKGAAAPPAANIGTALIAFLRELLLLGVMTLVGSLLASRGAHLYFGSVWATGSEHAPKTAMTPKPDPPAK